MLPTNNQASLVHDDECIDDLQCGGLMLIQKKKGFRFGTDAVLLANFAKRFPSRRTIDLCTGTGIVALLLSAKTATPVIDAVEIQDDVFDMALRSVKYNHLEERIKIAHADLKSAHEIYGRSVFDCVTVNPPYIKVGSGIIGEVDTQTVSRHEVLCTLEDVVRESALILKPNGHLFMVHRPARLADIVCLMRKYKTEPKRMRLVHPAPEKAPNLLLIEGIRNGAAGLKFEPPLYVFNKDGSFSNEINDIYGRV